MHRKTLSIWAWKAYTPKNAQPHELKFELLDGAEKPIGALSYTKYEITKGDLSTPWGPARIAYGKSLMSGPIVTLNDSEFVKMEVHPLKKKIELVFPSGTMMVLSAKKGKKNDLEFLDDKGFLGIYEEKGTLPETFATEPRLSKDEIRMLPKDQRPRSMETREYTQVRLKTSGELPVRLEEVKIALMILTSWVKLLDEVPT